MPIAPIRKLLCATDFSSGAVAARAVACRLAIRHDAELVLAHAWHQAYLDTSIAPLAITQMVQDARDALATEVAAARAAGVARVSSRFAAGITWTSIVDMANEDPTIDAIVVGTHGRSAIKRFLLGSVAEKIIRHAPCSVLAVRGEREHGDYEHVACAVDFADESRIALDQAAIFAAPATPLTLIHVVELPLAYGEEPWLVDTNGMESAGRAELEVWASRASKELGREVIAQTHTGNPVRETVAVADADPTTDLLVVGSHGRTGLRRVVMGSVAERIVRHAPCSVLVARARPERPLVA
ncbi:MAG: universal stress protein [Proteobacteria bacterium]|nr:universal stress protein [Pseudomonadota bacterium]